MRPIALGRSNWIHIGSEQAGPRIAAIFSVVESLPQTQNSGARLPHRDPPRTRKRTRSAQGRTNTCRLGRIRFSVVTSKFVLTDTMLVERARHTSAVFSIVLQTGHSDAVESS